jgi:hypothetical protein
LEFRLRFSLFDTAESMGKFFFFKPDISTTASPIATKLHGLIVPEGSTDCRCLEGRISNRDKTISGLRKNFDLDFLENGLPNSDEIRGLDAASRPLS